MRQLIRAIWLCPEDDFGGLLEAVGTMGPEEEPARVTTHAQYVDRVRALAREHADGAPVYGVRLSLAEMRRRCRRLGLELCESSWARVAADEAARALRGRRVRRTGLARLGFVVHDPRPRQQLSSAWVQSVSVDGLPSHIERLV